MGGISTRELLDLWPEGDQSPINKPHLRYGSEWRWFEGERVPCPFALIADPAERERRLREYGELRRYLFAKHLAGLSEEEQRSYREGLHPSQSPDRAEVAEVVAEQFRRVLTERGIAAAVSLGFYHYGRITLDVLLPEWPVAGQWPDDLCFFHGFEAHICTREPGWTPPS